MSVPIHLHKFLGMRRRTPHGSLDTQSPPSAQRSFFRIVTAGVVFWLLVFPLACISKQSTQAKNGLPTRTQDSPPTSSPKAEETVTEEPLRIHQTVPTLIQVVHSTGENSTLGWLELREQSSGKVFQRIPYPDGAFQATSAEACDLNGDGYTDLMVLAPSGANNGFYYAYLYLPKKRQFRFLKGFDEIPNPEVEGDHIKSWYHTGGQSGIESIYRWRKGHLVMTRIRNVGPEFEDEQEDSKSNRRPGNRKPHSSKSRRTH